MKKAQLKSYLKEKSMSEKYKNFVLMTFITLIIICTSILQERVFGVWKDVIPFYAGLICGALQAIRVCEKGK